MRQSRIRYANSGIIHKANKKENQNMTPIIPLCFTPENSLTIIKSEAEQPNKKIKSIYFICRRYFISVGQKKVLYQWVKSRTSQQKYYTE